jgi:hypothetical protein
VKTRILLLPFGFTLILYGQVQSPGGTTAASLPTGSSRTNSVEPPTCAVSARGPHSRSGESVTSGTSPLGQSVYRINAYNEHQQPNTYTNAFTRVEADVLYSYMKRCVNAKAVLLFPRLDRKHLSSWRLGRKDAAQ